MEDNQLSILGAIITKENGHQFAETHFHWLRFERFEPLAHQNHFCPQGTSVLR